MESDSILALCEASYIDSSGEFVCFDTYTHSFLSLSLPSLSAQIGFNEINPFPKRRIEHMRAQYRLQIRAELEALDNLRSQGPPGPIAVTTPASTPQDPPTADLLGVGTKDVGPEPSYKELLAEEDSDEETIFLPGP